MRSTSTKRPPKRLPRQLAIRLSSPTTCSRRLTNSSTTSSHSSLSHQETPDDSRLLHEPRAISAATKPRKESVLPTATGNPYVRSSVSRAASSGPIPAQRVPRRASSTPKTTASSTNRRTFPNGSTSIAKHSAPSPAIRRLHRFSNLVCGYSTLAAAEASSPMSLDNGASTPAASSPTRVLPSTPASTFGVPTSNAFFQDVELPAESLDLITRQSRTGARRRSLCHPQPVAHLAEDRRIFGRGSPQRGSNLPRPSQPLSRRTSLQLQSGEPGTAGAKAAIGGSRLEAGYRCRPYPYHFPKTTPSSSTPIRRLTRSPAITSGFRPSSIAIPRSDITDRPFPIPGSSANECNSSSNNVPFAVTPALVKSPTR